MVKLEGPRSMNTIPCRYRIHTLSIYRDRDLDPDKTKQRAKHIQERGESERGEAALEEGSKLHPDHSDNVGETL